MESEFSEQVYWVFVQEVRLWSWSWRLRRLVGMAVGAAVDKRDRAIVILQGKLDERG